MSDSFSYGLGFLLGIILCGVLVNLPNSALKKYEKAIEECEKSLPRDQHCKVIGVVDDKPK